MSSIMQEKQKKVLVLHDFFLYRGWAERYNLMLADALYADIAASFWSDEALWMEISSRVGKKISFARESVGWWIPGLRQIYLAFKFRFSTWFVQNYDTVIFSNDSLAAVGSALKWTKKIFFAHSLPRYLFDRREEYYQKVPLFLRPIYIIFRYFLERLFFRDLSHIDTIWTNSEQLRVQIKHYTGRDAEVIHPPVNQLYFSQDGLRYDPGFRYFLSFSKFSYFKRIDRVIDAFERRPDLHLVLIYGERDPDRDELLARASASPNIHPVRLEDNNLLPSYIRGAIATIFIPKHEDFGMVAIESLSCGTPVIGVNEWGLRETIQDGVNGILVPEWAPIESLDRAFTQMTESRERYAKNARSSVKCFGLDVFTRKLEKIIHW